MNANQIIELAKTGAYIDRHTTEFRAGADLNGAEARRYLEANGFTVAVNKDEGGCGVAITTCGICLSTNGYIHTV